MPKHQTHGQVSSSSAGCPTSRPARECSSPCWSPFSLPVLALTALAAVALLIGAVVGAVLAAPFLLARRQWRSRDRLSGDSKPSRRGDGEARMRRRRSFGALGRPVVPYPVGLHRLNSEAFRGAGEVR